MRWLLLDEVLEIRQGTVARARSHVPPAAFSHQMLLIEMMAQTAGLLLGAEFDYSRDVVFAKVQKASFSGEALREEETLEITAWCEQLRGDGAWFSAEVSQKDKILGQARLLLMAPGNLLPEVKGSVTFHETFMKHFQVRSRVHSSSQPFQDPS